MNSHGPTTAAPPLDAGLTARLLRVRARLRVYLLAEGAGWVLSAVAAVCATQFVLDYYSRGLQRSMRATLLGLGVVAVLWVIRRRLWQPLGVPCDLVDVANLVERRYPALKTALISAVRFSADTEGAARGHSLLLVQRVVQRACDSLGSTEPLTVLDARSAKRGLAAMCAVALLAGGAWSASPELARLWFARNVLLDDEPWPRRTRLIVEIPGDELVAARGDDVIIEARAEGRSPREVDIVFRAESGQRGRETMVSVGRDASVRYRFTFKKAEQNATFYLEGGDDQTTEYRIRLLDRPAVVSSRMEVRPPGYTGLAAMEFGDGQRSAQVLLGSRVRIEIATNKPVVQATLMAGDQPVGEAAAGGAGYFAEFSPTETKSYRFALTDEFGLESKESLTFAVRVTPDEAPTVRLKLSGAGDMITPEAVLPLELDFADTYGLAEAVLEYQLSRDEGATKRTELPGFSPGTRTYSQRISWSVGAVGAVPGETLALSARAADFDDISGPNTSQSPVTRLRVVTREELLADLIRREQELRADFERLVDGQEQLRGQLLTEASRPVGAERAGVGAGLERRQRSLSAAVQGVRQQFERLLAERTINGLDAGDDLARLDAGIIQPLGDIARRDMLHAADTIRLWGGGAADAAAALDPQQAELLQRMRAVLSQMLQWEGYQEVVSLLRDIIRLQRGLAEETQKGTEQQADEAFED